MVRQRESRGKPRFSAKRLSWERMEPVIIANLSSGTGRRDRLERCIEILHTAGAAPEIRETEAPGHATTLARRAGARLVIAAGGDGTINEIVNGLSPGATLGVLPLGTANVLARELGIPLSPEAACRRILAGKSRKIDLGVARNAEGRERRFACMAGLGFDALVVRSVPPGLKRRLGAPAFVLTALNVHFRSRLPLLEINAGGRLHRARFVIVANGHFYGGSYRVARESLLDNGSLHVTVIEDTSTLLRPDVLIRILVRRPLEDCLPAFTVRRLSARSVEAPVPVQLDGEPWGELPMRFRVEPGALSVVC